MTQSFSKISYFHFGILHYIFKVSILFFLIQNNILFCLDYCPLHQNEQNLIRSNTFETIAETHRKGGELFNWDMFTSSSDKAYMYVKGYRCAYSQYSKIFQDFVKICNPKAVHILYAGYYDVSSLFQNMYTNCIEKKHQYPMAYYEIGKIYYDIGKYEECLFDIQTLLDAGYGNEVVNDFKNEDLLLSKGISFLEIGAYENAIECLSDLINEKPENKEAYSNRAIAYFETGILKKLLKIT